MKPLGNERFSVEKLGDEPNWQFYKIEESQGRRLLRSFTSRITQNSSHRTASERGKKTRFRVRYRQPAHLDFFKGKVLAFVNYPRNVAFVLRYSIVDLR
jgi:hypothetical protein